MFRVAVLSCALLSVAAQQLAAQPKPSPALVKLFDAAVETRDTKLRAGVVRLETAGQRLDAVKNAEVDSTVKVPVIMANGRLVCPSQADRLEYLESLRSEI